jgi:O-antigen ligase
MPPVTPVTDNSGSIDYFGDISWANLVDWMITICLSGILVLTTMLLAGVRPETQLFILPLYGVLFFLHGLWLAVNRDKPLSLHPLPVVLLPFMIWASLSAAFWSPVPWRGTQELSYFWAAFLFFWVTVNCVRTRAHATVLVLGALLPLGYAMVIGFYQFFQDPTQMANARVGYALVLGEEYLGQATGVFADPHSFACYLLILLPGLVIASFVPRLPKVLRVLCFYLSVVIVAGITFTQTYWAAACVVVMMAVVPWFCFKKRHLRLLFSVGGISLALVVFFAMYFLNPLFNRGLERALSEEGEGIRVTLWGEALRQFGESPLFGSGSGSFAFMFEHSEHRPFAYVPTTPHNDFLMVLGQYGIVGAALLFLPLIFLVFRALRIWKGEPFEVKLQGREGTIMPPQKFFLSASLMGTLAIAMCAFFNFIAYVPALFLYATVILAILAKSSYRRTFRLPDFRFSRPCYLLICALAGGLFWAKFMPTLKAQALEMEASQRLEHLVAEQVSLAGNTALIDDVIHLYREAVIWDSQNADGWIGLSAAICQLHFQNPANFRTTGARAVGAARRSFDLAPEYWLSSAQLGVALALSGQRDAAEEALTRAVELAPNSSNAHYYFASYLSNDAQQREVALSHVRRALEINPNNEAARSLERKLLIL